MLYHDIHEDDSAARIGCLHSLILSRGMPSYVFSRTQVLLWCGLSCYLHDRPYIAHRAGTIRSSSSNVPFFFAVRFLVVLLRSPLALDVKLPRIVHKFPGSLVRLGVVQAGTGALRLLPVHLVGKPEKLPIRGGDSAEREGEYIIAMKVVETLDDLKENLVWEVGDARHVAWMWLLRWIYW